MQVAVRSQSCVQALLRCREVVVSVPSLADETPLHIAARNGDIEVFFKFIILIFSCLFYYFFFLLFYVRIVIL